MAGRRYPSGNRRPRTAAEEAAFRQLIDDTRAQHNLSDVVGRRTKLKRAGSREVVGLCVFHTERSPSMRVNDALGFYHCFGCGAHGDVMRFVMETEHLGFMDALRWLGAADLPTVSPEDRARQREEDEAERAAAIGEARAVWDKAVPAAGTPAEVYARSRMIVMPLPPSIRFAMTWRFINKETGEIGPDVPALIGAVTKGDELVAVQRIFLRDGGRAKANGRRPKLSLGRVLGGALKLDHHLARDVDLEVDLLPPDSPLREIIITEGPEDALSIAQEMPGHRVWAALGTAMMPNIEYGPEIRSICIAGQNDEAGRGAVEKAASALVGRGFAVRTMWPHPDYKDWNDQLRGISRHTGSGAR